ncbi:MAG: hypothetical protein VB853_00450 [Pirellulales bacterium]
MKAINVAGNNRCGDQEHDHARQAGENVQLECNDLFSITAVLAQFPV